MATADNYHGKECTLVLKDDDEGTTYLDNTSTAINAKGFSVELGIEIDELKVQDSILRADAVRTYINVPVTLNYVKNDMVLIGNIMGTTEADKDIDGGVNAGTTRASINDTPTMNLYNLWGTATSGSNVIKVKAVDIAWDTIPLMNAVEDGWVEINLTGTAKQAYIEYDT